MQATQIRATTFRSAAVRPARRQSLQVVNAAVAGEVPSPEKRTIMNLLLAGAVGLPVAGLAGKSSKMPLPINRR